VVRQELALSKKAEKRGVALAPDCGLSPGMASILGGELVRRLGGRADALRLYVGGLPEQPTPPFHYQLVFSVEGLINEYVEPARILRKGKLTTIDPLTEPEDFHISGFSSLAAFHTSGGTSTLPETFEGRVGECFEKTLRYPGHYDLLCELKELGLFSGEKMKFGKAEVSPRAMMSKIFQGKFASKGPDVCIMRLEAHEFVNRAAVRGLLGGRLKGRVASFHHGGPLRSQNGYERHDEDDGVSGVDRGADAGFGRNQQARRRAAGGGRSSGSVPRGSGEAGNQD